MSAAPEPEPISAFKALDKVTWARADAGVPAGAVGIGVQLKSKARSHRYHCPQVQPYKLVQPQKEQSS